MTYGELLTVYFMSHPCFICKSITGCAHREREVTEAEIYRLGMIVPRKEVRREKNGLVKTAAVG
jgi:hypothetical protein